MNDIAGDQAPELPAHKRELIDWLAGYERTARLIEFVKCTKIGPEEAAAWQVSWAKYLTPRKLERSNRGAH